MIHPTALVDPKAQLATDVSVGPWTYIGPDVSIDAGTKIGPHVVIKGPTKIGRDNEIFQFNSIGEIPQDKKFHGEYVTLEIGDRNVIREFCTLNRGTENGGGITKIGNDNLLMAYVHVAHDCVIGSHTIFANNASLAGHVIVEDYVTLGGFSAIHQFCRLGAHSFIAKAMVAKDVLPFLMISGPDVKACGLNSVGLKRRGFTEETIAHLSKAYKIIFRQGLTVKEAITELMPLGQACPEVLAMIKGLENSERGIVR